MSTWNLGADDVSDETRAFRDRVASKDSQIAAQQDRIVKQAADLDELKERLHEALHKLTDETRRALQLEADLQQRSEDLRNEKIASENVKATLASALDKTKGSNMEIRELEVTLQRLSHTSDDHKARGDRLEKEKGVLETRVRELENNLRAVAPPTTSATPGRRVAAARPRSSSLSNFRITSLEQDVNDVRTQLTKKETELAGISQKFAQLQHDLVKGDNERLAAERKWSAQVEALSASLEEKEEELAFLREQGGDGSREDELLKRIEEDDAKIAALEVLVQDSGDSKQLKEKLRRLEGQLKEERQRRIVDEEQQIELVKENEQALNELEEARQELNKLSADLRRRDDRDRDLNAKAAKSMQTCDDPLMDDNSCLIDMDTLEPGSLLPSRTTQTLPDARQTNIHSDAISHIERLLVTVDRIRSERDSLRRDVQFLESESRFAIEALEAKLSASISTASNETVATIVQLRQDMDDLHAELSARRENNHIALQAKDVEIRRLGLHVQGLSIVLNNSTTSEEFPSIEMELRTSQTAFQEPQGAIKDLEERYDVTVLCLEAITSQRDDLLAQLSDKDRLEKEVDFLRQAEQDARRDLDEVMHQVSELNAHIDDIESERDSLTLQVTNLMTDLQNVQDELTNAESRYTNLQFHQLSNMTSNEATRTLRDHIAELERRVMRRTEQIGIHQHDIKRLETNLRLQEERLSEMMAELETMAAQKDAMVEDCADAREARDEALTHVEALEEELEASSETEDLVTTLISVVADTASRARDAIRHSNERTLRARQETSALHEHHISMQQQLEDKVTALTTLTQLSGQYRDELERAKTALSACQAQVKDATSVSETLEAEKIGLETRLALLRAQDHESAIYELERQKENLERRLGQQEHQGIVDDHSEQQLALLNVQHAETIAALQARLDEAENALEGLHTRHMALEGDHQVALEDVTAAARKAERQLEDTTMSLQELQVLHRQCEALQQEKEKESYELREELRRVSRDCDDILQSRDSLQSERTRLLEDLDKIKTEQAHLATRSREESLVTQHDLEKKVQILQARFEENALLLDISKEEAARLADRLQNETQGRAQDKKEHSLASALTKENSEKLTRRVEEVQTELVCVQDKLLRAEGQLREAEDERTVLQQDITTLEAEVQKSKSLHRYLETQVKDTEHALASLRTDNERIQADLARSEKACKAAEVNLSLQNAQHKRETSQLQREVTALRSRPNLEHALSELEERNTEMEELLRTKCAEIEENDDRVLEMLKEKKKLTAKVETLTRKVQNLQTKLAAAKATNTIQQPAPQPTVPQHSPPSLQITPPAMETAPVSRQRSVTLASTSYASRLQSSTETPPASAARKPSQRVVSGPSSLPRPKTPERTRATVPVFKARTPERQMLPTLDQMPSVVVIGKKRAAPDDFEGCENLPTQAFSPDGQDVENRTPRVRRVLNSLQSGFTPVRNQTRPTAPMPSPRRAVGTQISDMTNTPFYIPPMPTSSAKASSKRSWLGKIRGSSQVVDKPSGMRSLFERGETS